MPSFIFLKGGNRFKITNKASLDIHETLPVGTYSVGYDSMSNEYYLETIEDFVVDGKLYGNPHRNADRILQTFQDRKSCTGVLLAGEKGSGKTLLAKLISINAAKNLGIPTLVVNTNHCGETFNLFVSSIHQPVVMFFDEFEKVYDDSDDQERMLTLLDGVYPSKKLFLLTCNDTYRINNNMLNRPGRLYYMLEFHGVDEPFIREYCNDMLQNKEHIPKVVAFSSLFSAFNFDILKAMVEEMNRYGESPAEVLEFLNARPQESDDCRYKYVMFLENGKPAKFNKDSNCEWQGNPIKETVHISYCGKKEPEPNYDDEEEEEEENDNEEGEGGEDADKEQDGNEAEKEKNKDGNETAYYSYENEYIEFKPSDMKSLDKNRLVYVNSKGFKLILTKIPPFNFKFGALKNKDGENSSAAAQADAKDK